MAINPISFSNPSPFLAQTEQTTALPPQNIENRSQPLDNRYVTLMCSNGNVFVSDHVLQACTALFFRCLNSEGYIENKSRTIDLKEYSKFIVSRLAKSLENEEVELSIDDTSLNDILSLVHLTDYLCLPEQSKTYLKALKKAMAKNPDLYLEAWLTILSSDELTFQQTSSFLRDNFSAAFFLRIPKEKQQALFNAIDQYPEANHPSIQYMKGICYHLGCGVEKDFTQAIAFYRLAIRQGVAIAQNNLGYCYQEGDGVSEDPKEAVRRYRLTAAQGSTAGYHNLAYCYQHGIGVEHNFEEAVRYYQLTADGGCDVAQCSLGYCYENGIGVERNRKEAVHWYQLSAGQGNATAQNNLGYCYQYGKGVERNLEEAVRLFRLSAAQGNDAARNHLRFMNIQP